MGFDIQHPGVAPYPGLRHIAEVGTQHCIWPRPDQESAHARARRLDDAPQTDFFLQPFYTAIEHTAG